MSADPQSFPDGFYSLTGYPPMRWQDRLFRQLVNGEVPAALDLPTGLGKTSVMAIWLAARALAGTDALKTIPRRLVYIVDRRAVVDQATEEAEKLRRALNGHAARLKGALGLNNGPLPISTLRGAHVDNREWLDNPGALAIIVGTVDMIGSRLLFEGYGVSRKMRPYHAGLLGADTLIVLDEAHLVPPFQHLLAAIEEGKDFLPRDPYRREIVPRFRLLPLSATQLEGATVSEERKSFGLEPEDLADNSIAKQRVEAKKTLRLEAPADKWDASLAETSWALAAGDAKPSRVVVFCTRRDKLDDESNGPSVMGVQAEVERLAKRHKTDIECELLVGGRRVRERQDAAIRLRRIGFTGEGIERPAGPDKPTFLFATSAGEVGVDFDADHMVSDLAPWERMVQRLGRVNRRGGEGRQATVVVFDTSETEKKNEDRKTRLKNTLALLKRVGDGGSLNSADLAKLRRNAGETAIRKASTPEPLHPALTRALVDAWSMTSLERHSGRPDVAPWLRGWVEPDDQSIVIWRAHLPVREGSVDWPRTSAEKKEVEAFFEAAPAHESEKLETEAYRVADWLQDRAKAVLKSRQDVRGEQTADTVLAAGTDNVDAREAATQPAKPQEKPLHGRDAVLFVLLPDGSYAARYTLGQLAAERKGKEKEDFINGFVGKILIVDARIGGLNDGMLDSKRENGFPTADIDKGWSKDAGFRVRRATSKEYESKEDEWHFEDDFVLRANGDGDAEEWLVVEHFRNAAQSEDARSVSRPQELGEHQNWAERKARDIASKIGLLGPAAEALAVAAFLHDEGKRAPRWQRAFRAPHQKDEAGAYKVFAKTRGPINQQILDGYRHEFGSLPYAEAHQRFKALSEEWRDLVLHLIAAHHGQARPVIATRGCEDGPPSALEARAREVALRFARLQKRWGPWGLAWWEALLRAADQQASRDNDRDRGVSASRGEET
jgi:CRISPR-associated endonuclease/helicase Cas3